ncbi:talin-1 [Platysternon megacephalum]|uniref:Talin-1 n=1 Tax=Platysternon megacephalum TaxID=55544 RepID=A0A4D9DPV9_9SAUR|nr:talin-1 [Platysternon megacephalum]
MHTPHPPSLPPARHQVSEGCWSHASTGDGCGGVFMAPPPEARLTRYIRWGSLQAVPVGRGVTCWPAIPIAPGTPATLHHSPPGLNWGQQQWSCPAPTDAHPSAELCHVPLVL